MKYFLTLLFLTCLNFFYAQESDTTKVYITKFNINLVEIKEKAIESFADSINNFNGKDIPDFLLNKCLDISDDFILGPHPIESIRWRILENVENLEALKQILVLKEIKLNRVCKKRKHKRYLSEVDFIDSPFSRLIQMRINQLEYIEKLQHDQSYNDNKLINGKVVKIDSIDSYYLTYVENRNKSYKIISEKSSNRIHCNKIILDSIYDFRITQLTFNTKPQENSSNIPTPINYLDIGKCLRFKNSEICTEPGFDNLFKSEYLNGLCNKL